MIRVVCAVVENDKGEFLLCQRPQGKSQAGLWEFPGGKVDAGEEEVAALQREMEEELACRVLVGKRLTPVVHHYASFTVELIPFLCELEGSSPAPVALEHQAIEWVALAKMADYDIAPADVPILEKLTTC